MKKCVTEGEIILSFFAITQYNTYPQGVSGVHILLTMCRKKENGGIHHYLDLLNLRTFQM